MTAPPEIWALRGLPLSPIYFDRCPDEDAHLRGEAESDPCEGCSGYSLLVPSECGAIWRRRGTGEVVPHTEVAKILDPE